MAVLAYHKDRFEKANLAPVISKAISISALDQHSNNILTDPTIPANRVLKLCADCMTDEQKQWVTHRKQSDWRFEREMRPSDFDTELLGTKSRSDPLALKIPEVNKYSIDRLGEKYMFQEDRRMADLQIIAEHISKTTEALTKTIQSLQQDPKQQQVEQPSSARDFSARAPRGHGGRAD